jgi:FkbM family methyltransferase
MYFVHSLKKKITKFCFTQLRQKVMDRKLRPFSIDEEGLWFKTKYGFSVYSNLKDRILELDLNAAWEEMESVFILNNLEEGDVFVDVGAYIGYFSMLAAQKKTGKILAFEPVPKSYDMLNMNIKHNELDDIVETFNVGLGCEMHTAKFTTSLGPKNHIKYEVDDIHSNLPVVDIEVNTLDSLIIETDAVNRVDFIKVDIEGAEYDFLLGARKTIEEFKPIILMEIETHRLVKFNTTAKQIFNFMYQFGYKYLSATDRAISKGNDYQKELKESRNFIFYTGKNTLIY